MSEGALEASGFQVSGGRTLVIITGLSGAGKTNALRAFEDTGYFCVDNLPPGMIPAFMEAVGRRPGGPGSVAVVADIRGRQYFGEELENVLEKPDFASGWECQVMFLEADEPTLVGRYKESRRPHPAAKDGDVLAAIKSERRNLQGLREIADVVVDTSSLSSREIRERFVRLARSRVGLLSVSISSFGFKHGVPLDVDMLLDARFLPNPHYNPALRPLTGHDEPVREAVLASEDAREFIERVRDLLEFLIPRYASEGKTYFTLGIGCTGGRHRSVVIVEEIARSLRERPGINLFVRHRDLESE